MRGHVCPGMIGVCAVLRYANIVPAQSFSSSVILGKILYLGKYTRVLACVRVYMHTDILGGVQILE